jgi:hypothetical protein
MANGTIKGNASGSTAAPSDLTASQVRGAVLEDTTEIDAIADGDKLILGDVSASAGSQTKHVLWSAVKTALGSLFAGITHAADHAADGDDPIVKRFSIAVTATWTGAEAPYTQEVSVEGVTSDMVGKFDIVFDAEDDLEDQILQRDAWRLVDRIDSGDGKVTLTCMETEPETAFNLQMEVV